ncbi:hypothetical protein IFR04_008753 [Cadophora malorum]|uniref:Uncharacterized protein n=1 Tax=Cadophora malorum TaxID=108018 RepID=A0A8H7W7E8_9HELO|nr:hypothetical protein IFR04_008753 [Cadophora malorum]
MAVDTAQVGHGPSEIEVLPDSNPFATPFDNIKEPSVDSAPIFDIPPRNSPKINPFKATFNVVLAFGIIGALIAGYIIGLRIFNLTITSIGLYGTILITHYLFQLCCALLNRISVNRIANKRLKENAQAAGDSEKGTQGTSALLNPDSEVSIAVVGYREDEKAWRQCLRSLQTQTLRPKCVIGVVDGNEEPDLSMANAFVGEFESYNAPLIHLPLLLSDLHRETYFANIPKDTRFFLVKVWHWLVGRYRPGHAPALALARQAVLTQVLEWDDNWNISGLKAVCFSQPHGHKRTAMFTAFAMSIYALRTRDAVFTTDSDTLIQNNGLDEMLTLLHSSPDVGGVTADVKIWNRAESLLARLCAARYWLAFNIERACQSMWACVGCLSGPMSMYRASDLETILGPWNLQTFGGKATTFGDDRHLTNQLLAQGLRTRYTHRTWCDSESPTSFVRWVAQQTRWSKSFFREAFWFPASFAYQAPWMLLETTIQALYPFILIATVFHFLFDPATENNLSPVIWLVTMFAIAFVKSFVAMIMSRDPWMLLFSCYGFLYFFGLLPSKVWALFTMNKTGWGTSARSSSERKYLAVCVGIGFFVRRIFGNPLFFLIGAFTLIPAVFLYLGDSVAAKLSGWFGRKKPASEKSTEFQIDEPVLPTKPSPVLKSPEERSPSLTRGFGGSLATSTTNKR